MNISRFAQSAILCLAASFLPINSFVAQAATVPAGACLYALDATADRAFQIAGAPSVYTACGAVSESSASDGFEMEGTETLYLQNHSQVSVVGGAQLNGQTELWDTISNKQVQPVKVTSPGDPLASIAAPTSGTVVSKSHASFDMNNKPANDTLSPGVYCGGLTIGNTNGATFTMSPGVYIMAGGGLTLNSQAVVKGTGVTVYNTSSAGWGCSSSYSYTPVTISGQVTATLSAPTSGAFDGILFFGNRTGCATAGSCQDQINGGSTVVFNGALYFKSDQITISGSNASGYMMLVADKIYINGNSTFGINGDPFDNITVSVSPSASLLYAGQRQQFTATTNSADTAVTWTISPAGVGTVSASGLYTAPDTISAQQTVTVTATSQVDTSKSASATVTLEPPVTVSVSPATATLYGGQTAQLTATVTNTSNMAVAWTISPAGVGTVSASGLYTAPATISAQQTVKVTATSQEDASKSASATVTLMPKTNPTITWATPAAITYGTALSATQLDATASVQGTFAYTPASGVVSTAGSQTLLVTFTPTLTAEYNTATDSVPLTVNPATATVTLGSLAQTYTGSALTATASTTPNGLTVNFTYNGNSTAPTAAGSYTVVGTISDANYQGSNTGTLVIGKAAATVTLGSLAQTYTGSALTATASTTPNGLTVNFTYNGSSTAPTAAGSYTVVGTISDANYQGSNTGTLVIGKAAATVTLGSLAQTYTGSALTATASTTPNGLTVNFTYNGSSTAPTAAGSYTVVGTISDANYQGSNTGTLVIGKAAATVTLGSLAQTYTGSALTATASTTPNGLTVNFTYNGSSTAPTAAGSYTVVGTISDANYQGSNTGTLVIGKAAATVTLGSLAQTYTGSALTATASTTPNGLTVNFTYNGSSTAPTAAGSYTVVGTISDANYQGSNTGTLVIGKAAATVTLGSLAQTYTGSALTATASTTPNGLTVNFTYNGSSTAPTAAGSYTVVGTISDANYQGSNTGTLVIGKAAPAITWATPAAITYGTALSGIQLNASSTVGGTYIYTPAAGTVLAAGSQTLSVTFTPTDSTDYTTATNTVQLTVNQATQTINFPAPASPVTYGVAPIALTATASSGLPVTFSVLSGPGTISNSTLTISGAGTVVVAADQSGNSNYAAAAQVAQSVTVNPVQCVSSGYSYVRSITIDHTKVPNTDQINFPFLFNTTDPTLATIANGGHITNENAYDVIFTSDPAGQNPLNYELEEYNPVTGQVIAWIHIPTLSHSSDTVLYMFYGNSAISASQQNPTGVWDSNYMGVWHVANNGGQLSLVDSTNNGNNATNNGATSTAGQIDGGMQTSGGTYATIGTPSSLANLAQGQFNCFRLGQQRGRQRWRDIRKGWHRWPGWMGVGPGLQQYYSVFCRRLQLPTCKFDANEQRHLVLCDSDVRSNCVAKRSGHNLYQWVAKRDRYRR